MIVHISELMNQARQNKSGIVCFEAFTLQQILWTAETAERLGKPAALMLPGDMTSAISPDSFMAMANAVAKKTKTDLSAVFSNARNPEEAERAIDAGFLSVVLDTSYLPLDQAIAELREFTKLAHGRNVDVTGVAGANYTVEEAAALAKQSGVDALQVAAIIENAENCHDFSETCHWYPQNRASLALSRLSEIHQLTGLPLALNGCHNVSSEQFRMALTCGVARIDDGCPSDTAYAEALRAYLNSENDPPSLFGAFLSIKNPVEQYLGERMKMLEGIP